MRCPSIDHDFVDKDSSDIWNLLSKEEKAAFDAMLSDGRLGNMVDLWSPWWKVKVSSLGVT